MLGLLLGRPIHRLFSEVGRRLGVGGRRVFFASVLFVSVGGLAQYKYYEVLSATGNRADIQAYSQHFWLRSFFGRTRSRWTGWLLERPIAPSLRKGLYTYLAKVFSVDLSDVRFPLDSYKSLAHVFSRTLADGARPIEDSSPNSLVSPCDGRLINYGVVQDRRIPQVKDATYNLSFFLGTDPFRHASRRKKVNDEEEEEDEEDDGVERSGQCRPVCPSPSSASVASSSSSTTSSSHNVSVEGISLDEDADSSLQLHYCVLYLAPRDYHHFHSPCEFDLTMRRHFAGDTLPVFRAVASRINDIFAVNERVVLSGQWKYGQMHYAAVGSYNVGHIRLKYEPDLRTNQFRTVGAHHGGDVDVRFFSSPLEIQRGERLGEFRLGSTIVLVFEAPKEFKWDLPLGSRVKMGQRIAHVESKLEKIGGEGEL